MIAPKSTYQRAVVTKAVFQSVFSTVFSWENNNNKIDDVRDKLVQKRTPGGFLKTSFLRIL